MTRTASTYLANAPKDLYPRTLREANALQRAPQAFVSILDNANLEGSGVTVTLDLTAAGGAVTTHQEGTDWNAGDTEPDSATNLAASLNIPLAALGNPGSAAASGATATLSLDPVDWGNIPNVGSDDADLILINDAWGSEEEDFHQWWDPEFNTDLGGIQMLGTDFVQIYLHLVLHNASAVSQVQMRLKVGMEEALRQHGKMYYEVVQDPGAAAGGVMPVSLPISEYQLDVTPPVAGVSHIYRVLSLPCNDLVLKPLVTTDAQPHEDDSLEIKYARVLREAAVG